MRTKYVGPIRLPADLYQRLEERALANERDPVQECRWLLRQALTTAAPDRPVRELVTAAAGPERPEAA